MEKGRSRGYRDGGARSSIHAWSAVVGDGPAGLTSNSPATAQAATDVYVASWRHNSYHFGLFELPSGTLPVTKFLINAPKAYLGYRELDNALGLTDLAGVALSDGRRGKNTRHVLTGLLRQSVLEFPCRPTALPASRGSTSKAPELADASDSQDVPDFKTPLPGVSRRPLRLRMVGEH
jgi:hypothetical protein